MKRVAFGLIVAALSTLALFGISQSDRFAWPNSGAARIEEMAEILRRIEGPARWCAPSQHPKNIAVLADAETRACMAKIAPAAEPDEVYERGYIKQFYRATSGDKFCEVTLSTVFGNDRVVGSDCYFGLFERRDDEGLGMTDDPFG